VTTSPISATITARHNPELDILGYNGSPAEFHGDPTVAVYVAAILRDDSTALTDGLSRLSANSKLGPPNAIGKAIEKVEELLSYGGRGPTGL
jgi:hypothetical protein